MTTVDSKTMRKLVCELEARANELEEVERALDLRIDYVAGELTPLIYNLGLNAGCDAANWIGKHAQDIVDMAVRETASQTSYVFVSEPYVPAILDTKDIEDMVRDVMDIDSNAGGIEHE